MSKWVKIDRRYKNPHRWTPYAYRAFFKWAGLVLAWLLVGVASRGWLSLPATAALIWYAVHRIRIHRREQAGLAVTAAVPQLATPVPQLFNPAPGWPAPPAGWTPQPDWRPDPSWPPAPPGWQFWIPDEHAPVGQRNTRAIAQDIKIAVAARDGGKCRQCGSAQELHFDHVIPWSKGGANTISNLQLLCGPCNRRKGADDIPARI